MNILHQGGGFGSGIISRRSICLPRCVNKMLRLEEKMEMQRPPSGINDGVPAIFVTSAKAPIKFRKRAFVEVAFRAARPSQDLFELGEILGIDLVSDNDQSCIGSPERWTLSSDH